jgi:hypothetical protein
MIGNIKIPVIAPCRPFLLSLFLCIHLSHRPENSERQREWVHPEEAQRRIRAWYSDPTLAEELDEDTIASGGEMDTKGKMDKKGGAMELAFKAFIEAKGWKSDEGAVTIMH